MIDRRTALCGDDVIDPVLLEEVRPLDPDRLLRNIDAAIDNHPGVALHGERLGIELFQPDRLVALIQAGASGIPVVDHPHPAVVVKEQRGIDARHGGQPHGVGPRACRIGRGDDEILFAAHARVHDVEPAIMVADCGREHAARHCDPGKIELPRPVDRVADLAPVHQVPAVPHGDAGEPGEGRVDEIIVLPDPHDAGVWIIARDDRVAIVGRRDLAAVRPAIFEPAEARWLGRLRIGRNGMRCDQRRAGTGEHVSRNAGKGAHCGVTDDFAGMHISESAFP